MSQQDPYGFRSLDHALLEAEVSPSRQTAFVQRYQAAAGAVITPGNPQEFQSQPNKWGAECRVYFNSDDIAMRARSLGLNVEDERPYRPNYKYRISNQELWWELVESFDFRLGVN